MEVNTLTIDIIKKYTCDHYSVALNDMSSKRRFRSLVRPRQVAMYLARKLTKVSLIKIGQSLGGKDHATVMHGVRQIDRLISSDSNISNDIAILTEKLMSI